MPSLSDVSGLTVRLPPTGVLALPLADHRLVRGIRAYLELAEELILLALAVVDVCQVVIVLGKRIGRLRTAQLDHGGQPKGCGQLAQARCAVGGAHIVRDLLDPFNECAQLVGQQLKAVAVEPFPQLAICQPALGGSAQRCARQYRIEHKR